MCGDCNWPMDKPQNVYMDGFPGLGSGGAFPMTISIDTESTYVRWTPASTPPPKDGLYLVTYDFETDHLPLMGIEELFQSKWIAGDAVIAWAPLPEPYRPIDE